MNQYYATMPILTVHLDRIENLADEDHIGKVRRRIFICSSSDCAAIFCSATNRWSIRKNTYCQHIASTYHHAVPCHLRVLLLFPLAVLFATFASRILTSRYVVSFGSCRVASLLFRCGFDRVQLQLLPLAIRWYVPRRRYVPRRQYALFFYHFIFDRRWAEKGAYM